VLLCARTDLERDVAEPRPDAVECNAGIGEILLVVAVVVDVEVEESEVGQDDLHTIRRMQRQLQRRQQQHQRLC
jgi:hypothetical protein